MKVCAITYHPCVERKLHDSGIRRCITDSLSLETVKGSLVTAHKLFGDAYLSYISIVYEGKLLTDAKEHKGQKYTVSFVVGGEEKEILFDSLEFLAGVYLILGLYNQGKPKCIRNNRDGELIEVKDSK